jgi:pimeloyl-ACP methyl ester carboxylesterase
MDGPYIMERRGSPRAPQSRTGEPQEIVMLTRRLFSMIVAFATVLGLAGPARAQEVVDGSTGPGSVYRLIRPTNWNGILLLYAHGYVSKDLPVAIPPDALLVASLVVPRGFAVAISSFSENGWVVDDGTQRTHQLLGLFTSKFGNPARVYVAGASMGGLIAIRLAETWPGQFAGLLPACAVAGGLTRQYDYVLNVRVLFDLFYPGVLPGTAIDVPAGLDAVQDIITPAIAAMTVNPAGAAAIAAIAQTPVPFASGAELLQSIATALVGAASYPEIVGLTHGQAYFDNTATQYTGALSAAALAFINGNVQRFPGSPAGQKSLEHSYTPTGDLQIPALTLSTFRDPVIPGFHRSVYGQAVAATGNADLLVQRSVAGTASGYGHCTFTPQELTQAFLDLVLWGEFGVKPTP